MPSEKLGTQVRIWDVWVRTFHWALSLSIIFLLLSGKTGFLFFDWHRTIGEFVLLLMVFRILWGVVGSSNAALMPLIASPKRAVAHLKQLFNGQVAQERGHNAAGGWAVLLMFVLVSFQAASGLFLADEDELIEGAFYGVLNGQLSTQLLHLHHLNAQLLTILVCVHVIMVLFYLVRARQNLIIPMLTGLVRWKDNSSQPVVRFTSNWVGLVVFVVCAMLIGWLLRWFSF